MTEWSEIMTSPRVISMGEFALKLMALMVLSGATFLLTIVVRKAFARSQVLLGFVRNFLKPLLGYIAGFLRPFKVIWLPIFIVVFGLIIPMNFVGQCLWPYSSWELMNFITGLVTFLLIIRCIMLLFKIHLKNIYGIGPKLIKAITTIISSRGVGPAKFFNLTIVLSILLLNFLENIITCAVLTRHMGFGLVYATIFVGIIAWMTVDAFEAIDKISVPNNPPAPAPLAPAAPTTGP